MNSKSYVALAVLLGVLSASCTRDVDSVDQDGADLILSGARIFTSDERRPWAEAVAIENGRFVYVGDDAGASELRSSDTKVVDLQGRLLIPGLVDAHAHPGYIGVERFGEITATTEDELLAAVRQYAEEHPGNDWLRLCCWPVDLYVKGDRGPDKRVLDAVVSERPVWFVSEWWHSSWLNSRALEELGVDEHTPDPKTGVAAYARDDSGEPTGWVLEGAGWQHFAEQFPIEDADHRQSHQQDVLAGLQILSESGVTAVYDGGNFGFEDLVYGFMAGLEKEEKLPVRVEGTYQVFTPDRMGSAVSEMKRYRREYGGDRLQFNAVKLFMDGIYPNRTSALLEPHTDNPSYVGDTVLSVEELRDFLLELNAAQLDAHIHAMGDLAVKRTLDAVEQARGAAGEDFYPRVTITHVGLVDPADLPRIEELGVICNFTPWWFTTDPDDSLRVALGGNRYDSMYKPNSLLDLGIDVTFSSDEWWGGELLPTYLNPYFAMQVGHTRQYPSEWRDVDEIARPPANERLSIEQLLVGYTLTGAYQLRMDDEIGSIEEGKLADLVVLDDDLFEIEPDEIWKTKPAAVLMEGEVIRGALPAGTRQ